MKRYIGPLVLFVCAGAISCFSDADSALGPNPSIGPAGNEFDAERPSSPLPPPPTLPGPFELDCHARAAPSDLERWLDDTPHCHARGAALFEDATLEFGIVHSHRMPAESTLYQRLIGGGVVVEDLNNDGSPDLYLSNAAGPNRLFLNDGTGRFTDCTAQTGTGLPEDWTNGVSAADYDNDGWQDLYVANRGPDRLLKNHGDGTFSDVTEAAGLGAHENSSTASWGDLDGDGDLDLVVATLAWDIIPSVLDYEWARPRLYLNNGDGSFEQAGTTPAMNAGASFIAPLVDLDDDNDLDLLITQEYPNRVSSQYFRNDGADGQGDIRWTESDGSHFPMTNAVMGVAAFDVDADGSIDLALSNLVTAAPFREALLINRGEGTFIDAAPERGAFAMDSPWDSQATGQSANRFASWAMVDADVDNDADQDLYVSYGHFSPGTDFSPPADEHPPMRPNQRNAWLENQGDGHFTVMGGTCAEDAGQSRGAVAADLDMDGCLDLVVVNQNGSVRVLRNRCEHGRASLSLRLVGTTSNRDAIGARVRVRADGITQRKWVFAGSNSVHSAAPKSISFGLGEARRAEALEVQWPSGVTQRFTDVPSGHFRLSEPTKGP